MSSCGMGVQPGTAAARYSSAFHTRRSSAAAGGWGAAWTSASAASISASLVDRCWARSCAGGGGILGGPNRKK